MQKAHDASYNNHWKDKPDLSSPILAAQLNRIEQSTDTIDDRVVLFDSTKANQTDMLQAVRSITLDSNTGVFRVTFFNGTYVDIDTKLEKIAINFRYISDPSDEHYQCLELTLDDGTKQYIDLSALITQYEFLTSSTIQPVVGQDGKITFNVIDGSITESKLEPNFLANCRIEVGKAEAAATAAEDSAEDSEAWAVGQRDGQDVPSTDETYHNNAKYYAEQAAQGAGVLTFNGRYGDVVPTDGDYSIGQISPSTGATEGQIPIVNSDGEFEMQDIPSSGHTIENTSGTSMTQREGLQFVGVFVGDDSIADRTKVNIARSMTRAQMDALTSAQKKGFIRTTDEPDNPIVDGIPQTLFLAGNENTGQFVKVQRVGNIVVVIFSAFTVDISTYPNGTITSNLPSPDISGGAIYAIGQSLNDGGKILRLSISKSGVLSVLEVSAAQITQTEHYVTGQLVYTTQN